VYGGSSPIIGWLWLDSEAAHHLQLAQITLMLHGSSLVDALLQPDSIYLPFDMVMV
jgi:hypothetical protein